MTSLQILLYTYSLMKRTSFRAVSFNGHTISQTVLPLLETFTQCLYQNSLQSCHHIFSNIPDMLKCLFIQSGLYNSGKSQNSLESKSAKGQCSSSAIHYRPIICHKLLDRGCLMIRSLVMMHKPIVGQKLKLFAMQGFPSPR